jgi:hypothetical protein
MRYFDKDFFKFTFGFLTIICGALLLIVWATTYSQAGDNQVAKPQSEMQN